MGLFFKKKESQLSANDRDLIANNSKYMDVLIVLAKGNEKLVDELKKLQETLKYLIPSTNSKVIDADEKIKHITGDLKIALTKADGDDSNKVDDLLVELKVAIADRNTKL